MSRKAREPNQQQQQQQQHQGDEGNQDDDEIDDDVCLEEMGFLFEGSRASELKRFEWPRCGCYNNSVVVNNDDDIDNYHHDQQQQQRRRQQQRQINHQNRIIRVALHVADDEPGAVISGHYLWPAAPALAQHLINKDCCNCCCHDNDNKNSNHGNNNDVVTNDATTAVDAVPFSSFLRLGHRPVRATLELGAGCALVSLVALQMYAETLQCVVVTDHDPGTLRRAKDNYETTLQELQTSLLVGNNHNPDIDNSCLEGKSNNETTTHSTSSLVDSIASIPVLWEALSWGDTKATRSLLTRVNQEYLQQQRNPSAAIDDNTNYGNNRDMQIPDADDDTPPAPCFDVVFGSDLIYCLEVIRPLFVTASELLMTGGQFYLSQSFPFDDPSEHEIDSVCEQLGFSRTILSDSLLQQHDGTNGGVRIQEFVKRQT